VPVQDGSSVCEVGVAKPLRGDFLSYPSNDVRRGEGLGDRRPLRLPRLKCRTLSLDMRQDRRRGEFCPDVKYSASSIISPRTLSLDCRAEPSKLFDGGLPAWINVVVSLTLSLNFVDSPETVRHLSETCSLGFALLRQVWSFKKAS